MKQMNLKDYGLSEELIDAFQARQEIRLQFQILKDRATKWEPKPYVSSSDPSTDTSCGCDGGGL